MNKSENADLRDRGNSHAPVVLALGLEEGCVDPYTKEFVWVQVNSSEALFKYYDESVALIVLGQRLEPSEACQILARCRSKCPRHLGAAIVLNATSSPERFQHFLNEGRILYLAQGPLSADQLLAMIMNGVRSFKASLRGTSGNSDSNSYVEDLLDYCNRISQQVETPSLVAAFIEAAHNLIHADRAQYLLYDATTETLRPVGESTHNELRRGYSSGHANYKARTCSKCNEVDQIAIDQRHNPEPDSPGSRDQRLIAQPLLGPNGALLGVVSVIRDGMTYPFSAEEVKTLGLLAAVCAPVQASILSCTNGNEQLSGCEEGTRSSTAVLPSVPHECHTESTSEEGTILNDLPTWLRHSYAIAIILILTGFLYICAARIDQIVAGPVLIRAASKISVTATSRGSVGSVAASTGDRVREGDLIVRLQSVPGDTLLDRLKEEVRAPARGTINDIRIRRGQELVPGDQIASIVDEGAGYEVMAFFPGAFAPQIRSHMPLVLRIQGYPDSREVIPIETIGTEIVGPQEASRYAGKESTGALVIAGPVVIARAFLRNTIFQGNGRNYSYHDGMIGVAEVSVRSDPIVLSLVPGLKEILTHPKEVLRFK